MIPGRLAVVEGAKERELRALPNGRLILLRKSGLIGVDWKGLFCQLLLCTRFFLLQYRIINVTGKMVEYTFAEKSKTFYTLTKNH